MQGCPIPTWLFNIDVVCVIHAFAGKIEIEIQPPDVACILRWIAGKLGVVNEFGPQFLTEYVTDAGAQSNEL